LEFLIYKNSSPAGQAFPCLKVAGNGIADRAKSWGLSKENGMDAAETPGTARSGRRRWFQYSLRTLLGAVLVASLVMSWFAVKMLQAKRQAKAVEAIRNLQQLGNTQMPRLVSPAPSPTPVEAVPRALGSVAYDYELVPGGEPPGPEALRNALGLDFLANAAEVTLSGLLVTDAQLVYLKELPALKSLYLIDTGISDAGLKQLQDLPQLEHLVLQGSQVSDSCLEHLKGLKHLRRLELCGDQTTDAVLQHLKSLPHLEELNLDHTHLTNAGLQQLGRMRQLRILTLDATHLTDTDLEHLKGLDRLQELYLYDKDIAITKEGLQSLQRALPNCRLFGVQ
jgi:hypothetical protein